VTRLSPLVHALARRPRVFDALRFLLEAGFAGERRVLHAERCAAAAAVLDLGCGTGALAGMFDAHRYVGVDMSVPYLARARDKHRHHRFVAMDGCGLAFRSHAFDIVVVGGVIHHLGDTEAARFLGEARRVLRPRGRLVLWEDVPTRSAWNVVGRLVQRLDEGDHIRPAEHYLDLVGRVFPGARGYAMRSGVCDYVVVVAGDPA
jgi:SAM-dependent methyltransferase